MTWTWSPDELSALGRYLADHDVCRCTVSARAIGDGHSNLTFLVSDGEHRVVVRRPPPPPLPPGAHDVLREARLVAALAGTPVPVPRVLAIASPGEILDVPLVVTEFVDAEVITDRTPKHLALPAVRREIGHSLVDTLVAIHDIDWRAIGLSDFGRPDGFNSRHLRRVCALVADDHGGLPAGFRGVADWLRRHAPAESGAAVVHNDFRIGNVMIGADGRVAAVLDWELATIGDPLFDLGYLLSCYPQAGEVSTPTAAMAAAVLEDGYPTRDELLDRYRSRRGAGVEGVGWYCAMAQFKLAVLYEYRRSGGPGSGTDSYFDDPALAQSFLEAAEAFACSA